MSERFWDWSLRVYGRPGVAPICLDWQDGHGADVNLVLLALWLASTGRELEPANAEHALALSSSWQDGTTGPLRAIRRRAKWALATLPGGEQRHLMEGLRRAVAEAELAAEHVQQHELEALVAGFPADRGDPHGLAVVNLARVLPAPGPDREHIRELIRLTLAIEGPVVNAEPSF